MKEYSEDYIDLCWFLEKTILRGENTREEVEDFLKGINPFTFKYD